MAVKKYSDGISHDAIHVESAMRILRLSEVIYRTGLARSTIYKLMKAKEFPQAVPLMVRTVGWIETEVNDWIKSKIEMRDGF